MNRRTVLSIALIAPRSAVAGVPAGTAGNGRGA